MNIALILSGGTGTRLGGQHPKQYQEVDGKPVIAYCLQTFEQLRSIDAIQIVAAENWHSYIQKWTSTKMRGFSVPGANRQLSVLNGMTDILKFAKASDTVIIHDAARPLVSKQLILTCVEACKKYDGAMPGLPVKDTMYLTDGEKVTSLIDRNHLCAGQSPEAYKLGKYWEANQRLQTEIILKINGSTEAAVLAELNIAVVRGDENNFKITTAKDMEDFIRKVKQL